MILLFSFSFANPVAVQCISEVQITQDGWFIEVDGNFTSGLSLIKIASSNDTVWLNDTLTFNSDYLVLTPDSVQSDLTINPEHDIVQIICAEYGILGTFSIGYENDDVPITPEPTQSVCYDIEGNYYYLDNTPTIGFVNDTENAQGIVTGTIIDINGDPLNDVIVEDIVYDGGRAPFDADTTETDGFYNWRGLSMKSTLKFKKAGYLTSCKDVMVYPDSTIALNITMQTDIDTELVLSYLPLQIGNKWQYYVEGWPFDGTNDDIINIAITGMETLDNGLIYYHFEPWFIPDYTAKVLPFAEYVRVDTSTLSIMLYKPLSGCTNDEYFWCDLQTVYDSSTTHIATQLYNTCSSNGTSLIDSMYLSKMDTILPGLSISVPLTTWGIITQGRGLSFINRYYHWSDQEDYYLTAAEIDGKVYGKYINLAEKYFPLHTGNKWQYNICVINDINNDTSFVDNYKMSVVTGDTIAPNNLKYKVVTDSLYDGRQWTTWFRNDTATDCIMVYDSISTCENNEYVYADFHAIDIGHWKHCEIYSYVNKEKIQLNFDDTTRSVIIIYPVGSEGGFDLAEGIGLTGEFYDLTPSFSVMNLIACTINGVQYGTYNTVEEFVPAIPTKLQLHQNYPNPFNPITTFKYELPQQTQVKLTIYNLLGREVAQLVDAVQTPGIKTLTWDAGNLASGIYFYQLQTDNKVITKKSVLLK